jgi:cytochrome oxidase assembly protein ShyY1
MIAFHVVCVATVVAMVNLSLWQFDRLDQRREFNSRVERRATEEVFDVTALDLSAPADFEWQRVGAAGTYQPADEVLILNRSQGGRAGLNVVTPLELEDGSILLVVRGFLPLELDVPRPPEGSVKVIGTARLSDARRSTDLNTSDGDVREFFRLDIDRIAEQIGCCSRLHARHCPRDRTFRMPSNGSSSRPRLSSAGFSLLDERSRTSLDRGHPPELFDDIGRPVLGVEASVNGVHVDADPPELSPLRI